MSCRQGVNKVLLLCVAVYLLLYIDRPLLPDRIRAPIVDQLAVLSEKCLQLLDPVLGLVGLDAATRGGDDYTPPSKFSDVPTIQNDEQLNEALKKNEMVFLMAHAPWCGHCKNMHGELAKLYDEIRHDFVNIPEGKMGVFTYNAVAECKDAAAPCKIESLMAHIRGFPTLLLIESDDQGKPVVQKYEQARSAKQMSQFLRDQILDPIMGNDALQAKRYFGEFNEGLLHYVPESMTIEQAKKKASGFSMRQQIFTRNFDVVKHFDRYNANMKKDEHIMLAFAEDRYTGMIPKDSPAQITQIITMFAHNAMGRFSDQKFLSLQLPRYLLLTRIRSTKFGSHIVEDFLTQPFIKPQIVGQAAIVLLDETEDNDRVAYMVGMCEGKQDGMILFDQMTTKRVGICVPCIAEWLSHDEFANYWLKAINGELPETNNANFKQVVEDKDSKKAAIVLSKANIDEWLKDHKEALVFTFSIAKHKDANVKKFNALELTGDVQKAVVDMTFDQGLKTELIDAKVEDKEQLLHFVDQKLVGTYDGEITQKKIEDFLKTKEATPTESETTGADL